MSDVVRSLPHGGLEAKGTLQMKSFARPQTVRSLKLPAIATKNKSERTAWPDFQHSLCDIKWTRKDLRIPL
jgi:hypothetical protein